MPTTMKLIAKNVLGSSASSVTFSNIPDTYTDLLLIVSSRTTSTASVTDNTVIKFNGSGSGYSCRVLYGSGSGGQGSFTDSTLIYNTTSTNNCTAATFGNSEFYVPNYAGSTNKSVSISAVSETNATAAGIYATAGLWANTSPITSIALTNGFTNASFVSGSSFFLYGITKA